MKKTIKAENKNLEVSTFDVDFAGEEPKVTTKKQQIIKYLQKYLRKKQKQAPLQKKGKSKNKPLVFDSVTLAAQYLTDLLNLKITNSKDCIYRALRGTGKTHNFNVFKNKENKIVLEPII